MDELCLVLQQAHYKDFARQLRTAFLTLSFSCTQGLSKLRGKASEPFVLTPFRRAALIDCIALLQNAGGLPDVPRYLLNRLGEAESLLRLFLLQVPTRILYIDYDADGQPTFCAASSRVPQLLRSALWNTREPAILTSGTLAAAGDFSHTKQLLGLAAYRPLRHFRADSPFNYKKKCLLYFPPRVKTRMNNRKMAEEIVRLVDACHGHALVLFTSYRQMAEVRALTDGQWPYLTYQAWRNGGKIIQKFKQSGNGVLFAAGSCWEGIDFPGDMVSLLIIAKLPFPIPDPVSDYERRQYPNLRDYINAEIIPEMQKNCGKALDVPSARSRTLVWSLFWTNVRALAAGIMMPRWQRCRPVRPPRKSKMYNSLSGSKSARITFVKEGSEMYLMRNHDIWIYVRCANSDSRIAFDRLYDLIDEAAGHGFLVRGTSFDHCSGNTLKDRIALRSMLDRSRERSD